MLIEPSLCTKHSAICSGQWNWLFLPSWNYRQKCITKQINTYLLITLNTKKEKHRVLEGHIIGEWSKGRPPEKAKERRVEKKAVQAEGTMCKYSEPERGLHIRRTKRKPTRLEHKIKWIWWEMALERWYGARSHGAKDHQAPSCHHLLPNGPHTRIHGMHGPPSLAGLPGLWNLVSTTSNFWYYLKLYFIMN